MTKRAFDLVVSAVALVLLLPLLLVVAGVVLLTMGRPVLFRQERPGRHERPFVLVKFRTMKPPLPGRELRDDEARLTRVGWLLRSSSLDELPELWNVLRGDMSLVGPRPLLMEYLGHYSPEQARRHLVRPGITGLAQVSGRNGLAWEERLALDSRYVDEQSFLLDLRLLFRTVGRVLRRDGISAEGAVSATLFHEQGTAPTREVASPRSRS